MDTVNQGVTHSPTVFPQIAGYEILEELGRGGMGVVYKAHQLKKDGLVALKVIRKAHKVEVVHLARFRIEAQAIACL